MEREEKKCKNNNKGKSGFFPFDHKMPFDQNSQHTIYLFINSAQMQFDVDPFAGGKEGRRAILTKRDRRLALRFAPKPILLHFLSPLAHLTINWSKMVLGRELQGMIAPEIGELVERK